MIKRLSRAFYDSDENAPDGNVLLSIGKERRVVLATILGRRFQQGPWLDYVKPYNLNPSVSHENIHEAGGPLKLRPVGAELEVGMVRGDGLEPTVADLDGFHQAYVTHALRLGACLDLSPELCIYQAELVLPPVTSYSRLLHNLEMNIASLSHAAHESGLVLAITSVYPVES